MLKNNLITVGDRLRYIREFNKLSQAKFAKLLNTSQSFICDIEKDVNLPGGKLLISLKEILNININWLLVGEGEMLLRDLSPKYKEALRQNYNLTEEEVDLFTKELFESPTTMELCKKLLKAKQGNKEAIRDMEGALSGLKMAYE